MMRGRGMGRVGRPSLLGTVARTAVVAGTATAVVGGMERRQAKKQDQQQQAQGQQGQAQQPQQAQQPPQPQSAAPAAESEDDRLGQLERLSALHQQGVLTDDEFAKQKAQILGG